jgi:hypothetical protein
MVAALAQAAHAASRTKNTYLSTLYQYLVSRSGKKKTIVAVAHKILVISYHLIKKKGTCRELGVDYFDKRNPQLTAKRLLQRLGNLGYKVTLDNSLPIAIQTIFRTIATCVSALLNMSCYNALLPKLPKFDRER